MNKSLAIIAAIAVIGLLFLVYLAATFESPEGATRTVQIEAPIPRPPEPPAEPEPQPELLPVTREPAVTETPVELPVTTPAAEPEPVQEVVELPTLNASQPFVMEEIRNLESGEQVSGYLTGDDLIRKFVVFAHNVREGSLPQLDYPIRRLPQSMAVRELDENLYEMQEVSYRRFTPLVDALAAINPAQGVALYETIKPLLADAYAEIGYRNRDFDEVVLEAIDEVLEARTAEGPFQLIKPKVMYVYADAEIEAMSPVEKQLLRMGPENAEKLKATLRQYRDLLAR